VLVTDWNPLTIYFYDECYARFSAEAYSDKDEDLDKAFVHLVNNSINKHSDKFHEKVFAENGEEIKDCMWSMAQLENYLRQQHGKDIFATHCKQRMRDIAKLALVCAQGQIEHRKNSWELYGYDYMIDDEFNPWLIEINSSPACDYSTTVTEQFVPRALTDVVKVVVDLNEWVKGGKQGPQPEIGGWENVYKGVLLDPPAGTFGVELACKGVRIAKPGRGGAGKGSFAPQRHIHLAPGGARVVEHRRSGGRPVAAEDDEDDEDSSEDTSEEEEEEEEEFGSSKPEASQVQLAEPATPDLALGLSATNISLGERPAGKDPPRFSLKAAMLRQSPNSGADKQRKSPAGKSQSEAQGRGSDSNSQSDSRPVSAVLASSPLTVVAPLGAVGIAGENSGTSAFGEVVGPGTIDPEDI